MANGDSSGLGCLLVIGLAGFLLYSCSTKDDTKREALAADIAAEARDDALDNAVADLSATEFADTGDISTCTEDCGGHNAGYAWAMENGVTSPGDCGGNSRSFIEGCEAYGEEIQSRTNRAAKTAENEVMNDPNIVGEY